MSTKKRSGARRAADKAQTSISLRNDLLQRARGSAAEEGRTFSNWLEQLLRAKFAEEDARLVEEEKDEEDPPPKLGAGTVHARDIATEHLPGARQNVTVFNARN
jgi:hypothetical protein